MKQKLTSLKTYLLEYTQTQLVITLVSLPILVSWGLGFSVMSFIGNLIFAPLLTIFLVISCLLFFSELLGIPNGILVVLLDNFSLLWSWLLSYGRQTWIVACAQPHAITIVIIPALVFYLLNHKRITTTKQRLFMLCSMLIALGCIFMVQRSFNHCRQTVYRFSDKLYCIKLTGKPSIILVDEGFFSHKKSAGKAVQYELRPWINKRFGSIDIRELRINKPTGGSFQAAHCICQLWKVHDVWLPLFTKKLSKYAWKCFFDMKNYLETYSIRFNRYNLEQFYPYGGNRPRH